jgi:hypothetical protein
MVFSDSFISNFIPFNKNIVIFKGQLKTKGKYCSDYKIPLLTTTEPIITCLKYLRLDMTQYINNPSTFHSNCSDNAFMSFLGNVRLLYIILAGVSLYLCSINRKEESFYQKRLSRSIHIGIYALLLSLVSHLFYPKEGIKFGILHFIALATLLISPIAYANSIPLTLVCLIISCTWKIPSINKPIDTILGGSIPYNSADWFPIQDYLKFMLFGLLISQIIIPHLPPYSIDPNNISEKILKWMGIKSLEYMQLMLLL